MKCLFIPSDACFSYTNEKQRSEEPRGEREVKAEGRGPGGSQTLGGDEETAGGRLSYSPTAEAHSRWQPPCLQRDRPDARTKPFHFISNRAVARPKCDFSQNTRQNKTLRYHRNTFPSASATARTMTQSCFWGNSVHVNNLHC